MCIDLKSEKLSRDGWEDQLKKESIIEVNEDSVFFIINNKWDDEEWEWH